MHVRVCVECGKEYRPEIAVVTNAELEVLGHLNQPMDVREGPVEVFEQVLSMAAKLRASGLAEAAGSWPAWSAARLAGRSRSSR